MDRAEKKPRVFKMAFASVYPLYVAKAAKKGRTKEEVDEIVKRLGAAMDSVSGN